jgi:hypothetical protein
LIDPTDAKVMYANSGYGVSGIFKSTNGGVYWTQTYGPSTWPAPYNPYRIADEANPTSWQAFGSAKMISGGKLKYSPEQRMLYASNMYAGVYRLKLP